MDKQDENKKPVRKVKPETVWRSQLNRESLLMLHETEGVGRETIWRAIEHSVLPLSPSLVRAHRLGESDWRDLGLSPKQAASVVLAMRAEAPERRIARYKSQGISVVTYLDEQYPSILREIADPPWVLYYIGRWELTMNEAVAIVGTRVATAYGRKMAEELATGCAERMTIVSGLARGVDTAAHYGALAKRCGTIAVLATPVNECYPTDNRPLYRQIAEQGLLVSEMPPGTALRPGLFPLRNRVIAGLSRGVIVVEAAEQSGALITANLALDYNRDVFVVPGQVTSPRSRGALNYFRKGAHPVLDREDVFEAYRHLLSATDETVPNGASSSSSRIDESVMSTSAKADSLTAKTASKPDPLTDQERTIYDLIIDQPCTIDELVVKSGMTFGLLHAVLLSLKIKELIHQQPGSVYNVL